MVLELLMFLACSDRTHVYIAYTNPEMATTVTHARNQRSCQSYVQNPHN